MVDNKKQGMPLYPNLNPSAPPASMYPGAPLAGAPYGQPMQHQGPPPPYGSYGHAYPPQPQMPPTGPPPSYYPNVHPAQQPMPMTYPQYPPSVQVPMPQGGMIPQPMPGASPYIASGSYAAGARFGPGGGQPMIPPPPPGYAPNHVQIAAMQGQTVVMDKKKNSFFSGGKGAGTTFW